VQTAAAECRLSVLTAVITLLLPAAAGSSTHLHCCCLCIFLQHILGDIISPPLIGYLSDQSNLQNALQVTWVAVLVSGLSWFAGYLFLPALPNMTRDVETAESGGDAETAHLTSPLTGEDADADAEGVKKQVPITYGAILFPCSKASRMTDDEPCGDEDGETESVSAADADAFDGFAETSVLSPSRPGARGDIGRGEGHPHNHYPRVNSRSDSYEIYVPPNLNPLLSGGDGSRTSSPGPAAGAPEHSAAASVGSSINGI